MLAARSLGARIRLLASHQGRGANACAHPATRRLTVSVAAVGGTHAATCAARMVQGCAQHARPARVFGKVVRHYSTSGAKHARSNIVSEHPLMFAGFAAGGSLIAYMVYLHSHPRHGLAGSEVHNVGGYELGCMVRGDGNPVVIVDMGSVALAHPLVERISKFTKVVAIDQQGQGASDADPTAVNPLRVLQVYSAAQIMADSTNALHVKDRKTALSRATGQVQSQTSVVDANRTHGESVLRDGGARNLLQPGTSAVEAAERIGLAGLPLEKVHSALQALESSAFAPPVGGGTVESNATALSSVLNATKTSPPVILVTSKCHWPTVAEFARRNGSAVRGIVLVDTLQGPGAQVTSDPQSPQAADIVRTVNMLEDGLAFSYCGRGRGAVPPMSRTPAGMPVAFENPSLLRKVFRHVVEHADVNPKWKWFSYVLEELGVARDKAVASVPHEALQELGNPSRPVTLCVTDPFLTPKGMRKLQWITVTKDTPQTKDMGRHETQLKESIEAEVERWRDVVPHLRVVRCIDDGPAAAEEQRWELVAREVQAMLRSVPQATADTSSPSDSDATA